MSFSPVMNTVGIGPMGQGDITAPVPTISTTAVEPITGAFSATIAFTNGASGLAESVTGFVVGDITVSNASLSEFAGSGASYTVTVTPTAAGDVSLSVAAGVCTDLVGNANLASNTLTVYALVGELIWLDGSTVSTMFQDAAQTSPVTADGQSVAGWNDKGANNMDGSKTAVAAPVYKANIQNGLSVVRFGGAANLSIPFSQTANDYTFIFVHNPSVIDQASDYLMDVQTGRMVLAHTGQTAGKLGFFDQDWTEVGDAISGAQITIFRLDSSAPSKGEIERNGVVVGVGTYTQKGLGGTTCIGGGYNNANYYTGDFCEFIGFVGALTDEQKASMRTFLAAKWGIALP